MTSIKRQARIAGLLYVLLAIGAPLGIVFVPAKLMVPGNAAATADNIRAFETLLRLGIASELFHQAVGVFLVLALYRLFKPVNEGLARHLVALGALVSVPIMFVNVLNELAALMLAGGADVLSMIAQPERDGLAYLFLRLHEEGITVVSVFWGLWLFPFGLLVIRSGFIPRVLGYLLLIAGAANLVNAFAALLLPRHAALVAQVMVPLAFAELPIIFWLAIWGARERPGAAAVA